MTKKIFFISAFVLILLIGVIFVYNFAFKKPTTETPATKTAEEGKSTDASSSPNSPTPSKNQPSSNSDNQAISAISDTAVFGATLAPDQNSLYYFSAENGQLNQVDFDGKLEKVISTEEFQNIQQVFWNKPKNRVIIKQKNSSNQSKFLLLDLVSKTVIPLKDNIDSISWSGLGDKIIYKFYDSQTKKRTLNVSDPDGKNWRKITDIDFFDISINPVPNSFDISFWPSPNAFISSLVRLIGFNGENKREILANRFGVDLLWSPDGKIAAVSVSDEKGGKKTDLAIMNSDGGQFQSLNFPTFVKKCAWSTDAKFLFCAMPGNIPEGAILPNDWQEGKIQTADTFWKIELASGKKDRLVEADKIGGSYDALNPFLSSDEKFLFFINKVDGKLYKLKL